MKYGDTCRDNIDNLICFWIHGITVTTYLKSFLGPKVLYEPALVTIHKLTNSLTNSFFCFPYILQIRVIELSLCNKNILKVKYVHVCVFILSLTRSISHG